MDSLDSSNPAKGSANSGWDIHGQMVDMSRVK